MKSAHKDINKNIGDKKKIAEDTTEKKDRGFIQIAVIIIIALVILKVLGADIIEILNRPAVKEFAIYVKDMIKAVWADILRIFQYFFNL